VEEISAELAQRTVGDYPRSVWQMIEHMHYGMEYELMRIAEKAAALPATGDCGTAGKRNLTSRSSSNR